MKMENTVNNSTNSADEAKTKMNKVLDDIILASTAPVFVNIIVSGVKAAMPEASEEDIKTAVVVCIKECYKGIMLADARIRLEQHMNEVCKAINLNYSAVPAEVKEPAVEK